MAAASSIERMKIAIAVPGPVFIGIIIEVDFMWGGWPCLTSISRE
jgi:hypothetical protein